MQFDLLLVPESGDEMSLQLQLHLPLPLFHLGRHAFQVSSPAAGEPGKLLKAKHQVQHPQLRLPVLPTQDLPLLHPGSESHSTYRQELVEVGESVKEPGALQTRHPRRPVLPHLLVRKSSRTALMTGSKLSHLKSL